MKSRIAIVVALMIAFTALQGCTLPKGGNETSSAISESSSAPPSTAPQINTNYEPLAMDDNGCIKEAAVDLDNFIPLLEQKNIPIVEIAGASEVYIYDGGSVNFEDTNWDYMFSEQMASPYDVNSLADLMQKQEIQAVYVKTPYEIYCFRQGLGDPGTIVPIGDFSLAGDTIITTNPRFVTEKGIKIGDSFEAAARVYKFVDGILKISDSDWSAWCESEHAPYYNIEFDGSKDVITSITLGLMPYSD